MRISDWSSDVCSSDLSAVIELVDLRCDCTDASAFADWAIAGTAAPRPAAASGASVQAARRVIVFLVIWLSFSFLQPAFRIRALNPRLTRPLAAVQVAARTQGSVNAAGPRLEEGRVGKTGGG